ncbi:MAG: protein kinase [Isosphaeraceae bacterium]
MPWTCPQCRNPAEADADAGEVRCPSCGSTFRINPDVTPAWEAPGSRRLGRFVLERSVGSGGFGTVWRAYDPQLDRRVAIKIPRAGAIGDGPELDRFLREGRSAAGLKHPGIVPIHDIGVADGVPYLVSEFVEGISLDDRLTGREFPAREAADLIARIADALHYAHEQGVVHRDVTPRNILFNPQ